MHLSVSAIDRFSARSITGIPSDISNRSVVLDTEELKYHQVDGQRSSRSVSRGLLLASK